MVRRRIANSSRYSADAASDAAVRVKISVPSIDGAIGHKRLAYLARVATTDVRALHAMLSSVSPRGQTMSWTNLVVGDLGYLRACLLNLSEKLQLPKDNIYDVWNLIVEYPNE